MAVKIRLTRLGKKKFPVYRMVVMDSRSPRDGRAIELVGRYNPGVNPVGLELDKDRIGYWLSTGAQPTDTVRRLLGEAGVMEKVKKVPVNPGVSRKELRNKKEGNSES